MSGFLDADRERVGERLTEMLRWIFIAVLVVLNNFGSLSAGGAVLLVNGLLAAWTLMNLGVTAALLAGVKPSRAFSLATTIADILIGSAILYVSNGFNSPYFLALFLSIVAASVRFGTVASFGTAMVITLIYLFVGDAAPNLHRLSLPAPGSELAGRAFLFFVVALVSGAMARQLMSERSLALARAVEAEALHAMSAEMASSLDVRRVFELVVHQAAAAVGAEQAMLLQVSRGGLLVAAQQGAEGRRPPAAADVVPALRSDAPVLTPDGRVLAARVNGGTGGGLVLWLARSQRPYADDELFKVAALLKVGACAVRNAFHYEERAKQASTDAVTGLFNRREFDEQLQHQIDRSRKTGEIFSLLLVDLDQFKKINDTHGHQAGDRALRETATLIRAGVRAEDLVARFGGDEMALILPGCDADAALETAERLLKAVRQAAIPPGRGPKVTLSIGCATYPRQGTDAETLIKSADSALYEAKRAGRDRLVSSLAIVAA